jgi:hypothetical protein
LGGFDEGFFLYMEDVDLAWRARRAGFTIWGIPRSVVRHRRAGHLTQAKLAHLRRGRARLLQKHLSVATQRRLAVGLWLVSLAERFAGAPEPLPEVAPMADPLPGRPAWLRSTLPIRAMPTASAKVSAAVINPLLVLNALAWRR